MVMAVLSVTSIRTSFIIGYYHQIVINHLVSITKISNNLFLLAVDSNGVLIGDFTPGKWYFLGLEHDKPFMTRAHLIAFVNDK